MPPVYMHSVHSKYCLEIKKPKIAHILKGKDPQQFKKAMGIQFSYHLKN